MIVTREFANNLDKATLAKLASEYATAFAAALGHKELIGIRPFEIIFEQKEANRFFFPKHTYMGSSPSEKKIIKNVNKQIKRLIKENSGFVANGTAYIPLSNPTNSEIELINKLHPENRSTLPKLIRDLITYYQYASIGSFGPEIAHLVGHELYPDKAAGFRELLDICSQIFEKSWDIKNLQNSKTNLEKIVKEFFTDVTTESKKEVKVYETLLFEGGDAAKEKLIELGIPRVRAGLALYRAKKDYIMTSHFDGAKLFVEIYDYAKGDLNKLYKKTGELLRNSRITKVEDALVELGYSSERILKYRGVFSEKIQDRTDVIISCRKRPYLPIKSSHTPNTSQLQVSH